MIENERVITVSDHMKKIPPAVRPIVQAARRAVKAAAPDAKEVAYQSSAPRSKSAMWKLIRYSVDDEYVVGIGTFSTYAAMFFMRGRELDDGSGLLEGSGKDARFTRLAQAGRCVSACPDARPPQSLHRWEPGRNRKPRALRARRDPSARGPRRPRRCSREMP